MIFDSCQKSLDKRSHEVIYHVDSVPIGDHHTRSTYMRIKLSSASGGVSECFSDKVSASA